MVGAKLELAFFFKKTYNWNFGQNLTQSKISQFFVKDK